MYNPALFSFFNQRDLPMFILGLIAPFPAFELEADWLSGNEISLHRLEVHLQVFMNLPKVRYRLNLWRLEGVFKRTI
jgi:hypothetical protein